MKLRQFVTVMVAAALVVQLNACTLLPAEMQEQAGSILGGIVGGVAADKMAEHAPAAIKPLVTAAGVLIGAELGKRLGKYLSEQDQKKWQEQVNVQVQDPKPQTYVACANDQNPNPYRKASIKEAKSKDCGKENKVIVTSSGTNNIGGQECQTMQTELFYTKNPLDTIEQTVCKGTDGAWHEKSV